MAKERQTRAPVSSDKGQALQDALADIEKRYVEWFAQYLK